MKPFLACAITSVLSLILPVSAQTWSGEGSVSAGVTTGNTETTDVSGSVKMKREAERWVLATELKTEYAETDGEETRNRQFVAAQLDRTYSDKFSSFTRATYKQDEFSGFDESIFLGLGASYKAIDNKATQWKLEGGPGFQRDELASGQSEESVSVRLASLFESDLNESVSLSNDTETTWTELSTEVNNTIALTAELVGNLSARFSFDVRYETDPPAGFENTDTATRGALVYTF